ncbi:MAG: PEP-utilizing enzyme [Candidatus Woesearchaeota archaeon]
MKQIHLAWTRDFTLAWAQWWSTLANSEIIKQIGYGIDHQLSYYNGLLLETYRLKEESETFIDTIMNLGSDNPFFSEEKINRYIQLVKEIRDFILGKVKADLVLFEKVNNLSIEMYPWYTASYLFPQEKWTKLFIEKNPEKNKIIIERLIKARTASEGLIGELCEYWRAVAKKLLEDRDIIENYASFVTYKETIQMLKEQSYIPSLEELKARSKGYIYFLDEVYVGITLKDFFSKHNLISSEEKIDKNITSIKGTVAAKGKELVQGKVQIILHKDQIKEFKAGNVLVTIMTNPFFLSAIKRASAIITDEGGLTCHAAITARELGIPTIIGTKIATKVLKEGDLVEVDTVKGIIKKIKEN